MILKHQDGQLYKIMTIYKVEDIFTNIPDDPDNVLMKIPDEICEQLGLKEGDTVTINVENEGLKIQKQ